MTYKQIEAVREARLWITQIVVPAACVAMLIPEVRETVTSKTKEIVSKFK